MAEQDSKKAAETVPESVPDPEEDDLDDLDEILDEFQSTKISEPKDASKSASAPEASGPGRPAQQQQAPPTTAPKDQSNEAESADEFAKQLQDSMAEMLRELETNPQMAKEFEEMMAQMGSGPPQPGAATESKASAPAAGSSSSSKQGGTPSFEDTIKRTMERMQASESSASAAAQTPAEEDFMAALMRDMQGAGGEGDDGFSKMLLGMMEQLTNKDILYEPMRELNSKFPAWIEERTTGSQKGTVPEEEMQKYREQAALVKEIVTRFEKSDYKDSNPEDREFIVERMQKMQAAGAPPSELVGDMSAAENMMGELDQGCQQQ